MIKRKDSGPANARPAGRVRTATLVGFATLANYLVWLGWDQTKYRGPDGNLHGPYQPWQVVGLVLVLGAIAAAAGWHRRSGVAVIVSTLVMTVCFSYQGATDPLNDGLWPIGAALVACGTSAGVAVVGAAAAAVKAARTDDP